MSHLPRSPRSIQTISRTLLLSTAVALILVLLAADAPASASMNKTRIMERDGQTLIVSQDVGNQAFPVGWVERDPRRHSEDGLTLYYRIDLAELPPGISRQDTEAAIESAVDTFNRVQCAKNLELVRVDEDVEADHGYAQNVVRLGGDPIPRPDITFAGWVPPQFFERVGMGGSLGLTVPAVFGAPDNSPVWGYDILAPTPTGQYTDIDADGNFDLYAMEMYFTTDAWFDYVIDNDEDELFSIDVESIVLHELGHALGMDHFGRSTVILDENGDFVDLIVNPNSVNLMNTANYFAKRDLSGSDVGSFCGIYSTWGK